MPTIEQLALECWLGRGDAAAIAAWSAGLDPSDPAADLRTLNAAARIDAFPEIARARCGYPPRSADGSAAASAILTTLCALAVDRQLALVDLADAVTRLEYIYVLDNQDPSVPAPAYVDELRELLDRCDASWHLDDNSTLELELIRVRDAPVQLRASS